MKILVILAVLFPLAAICLFPLTAQNKPSDTPKKRVAKGDSSTNGEQQSDAEHENQNSSKYPSVVVQVQSPPVQANRAEEDNEQKLAGYTLWLVIVTGLLVVTGIVQAYILVRQEKILHGARDEIRSQAKQTERQADLMGTTLILQFRPKLVVSGGEVRDINVAEFLEQGGGTLTFVIGNSGGSPAHIINSKIVVKRQSAGSAHSIFDGAISLGEFSLQPGERVEKEIAVSGGETSAIAIAMAKARFQKLTAPVEAIYFLGVVFYRDDLGLVRSMGFNRIYDAESQRFKKMDGDSDYEYGD